ncbi:MAG: 2-C-methyl-D-erythritol 4-phosphate cytidylyltransferase [Bacilli bacterium]|nr:2-C-methyl-D-erythritol 4-phosphate cytidylyltransferase [Bacilli bacterium]
MINNKKVVAVILAAGNSIRYGKKTNKNFEIINDNLVISYSLEVFDNNKYVDELVVAIKSDEVALMNRIIEGLGLKKKIRMVIGGKTRKDSVYNCIKEIDTDIVIIHDGARPLIKDSYVNECIENIGKYSGVTIGVKSKDTIKITDEDGIVINTTDRNNTWLVQTPQCFDNKVLIKMHEKFKNEDAFDDCYLLEKGNYKVKVIEGDYTNIKITNQSDLEIVKNLLKG